MIERFLAPVDADSRCGPDLEYDADFLLLQQCAAGRPEQQYGAAVIAEQTPDWAEVERAAQSLLRRTRDLRIAAPLVRAWIARRGLDGYADGLALVQRWLADYWDELHPAPAIDGELDPIPRMNALAGIVGGHACARAAQEQMLADNLTVRDAEDLLDGHPSDASRYPGGAERLKHEMQRLCGECAHEWAVVCGVLDSLDAIRATVTARIGPQWMPEPSRVERVLRRIRDEVPARLARPPADTDDAESGQVATSASNAETEGNSGSNRRYSAAADAQANAWRDAEFMNRGDVALVLEKMCRYFDDHEMGHPAPLLLRRVQRLLTLDFYELVRDIAPEGLQQVELLSGHGRSA
ncbi:ImpA-related N-terminal family protein [Paraburkholderia piptadeniae]|uniref:ImpA-related N-terminal family protein n=1 Tax=Paraburkholderia piptadeniae TaxID=1701573 RepID=A0A1N7SUU2_9BURK|nr:type VI secretion system protein TssA [Paraburkholderia piptadeniae]SIT51115.1 ImpA-related N-terminal family protein [Paraburkholderia piptadeniae]